jgi:hypothetical protein
MSITYTDAQTYTARVLGASGDSVQLAAAADSIKAAIQEWNLRHDFSYLLMDTSGGFTVAACTMTLGTTLTTTTPNGFAGVNIGQTAVGATIGTVTVTAIVSTTVLTVSGGANAGPETMTFSADIPVISGTDTYNLPSPIGRPYSARLLTNEWTLTFKEQREIDRAFVPQTAGGTPWFYNLFNTGSFTIGRQNGKIRLFPIPGHADTLRVRYFRPIAEPASGSDNLDVLDTYVYALLDLARYMFLRDHDSESQRLQELKERAELQFRAVVARDEQGTEDNDMALVPQMEQLAGRLPDPYDIRFWG